jgi:hypothetical protein
MLILKQVNSCIMFVDFIFEMVSGLQASCSSSCLLFYDWMLTYLHTQSNSCPKSIALTFCYDMLTFGLEL